MILNIFCVCTPFSSYFKMSFLYFQNYKGCLNCSKPLPKGVGEKYQSFPELVNKDFTLQHFTNEFYFAIFLSVYLKRIPILLHHFLNIKLKHYIMLNGLDIKLVESNNNNSLLIETNWLQTKGMKIESN